MYYANYIANSKVSNYINTKHQILKDKSKSNMHTWFEKNT